MRAAAAVCGEVGADGLEEAEVGLEVVQLPFAAAGFALVLVVTLWLSAPIDSTILIRVRISSRSELMAFFSMGNAADFCWTTFSCNSFWALSCSTFSKV